MPTSLALAGAAKPEHVFFQSLLPQLTGTQKKSSYESVYGAYLELQRSVTQDGWKLIAYPKARVVRLYHLAEDAMEMNDLASDPKYAQRKSELFSRLIALQKSMGDQLDLQSAFPGMQ
jgi:choline-sulfatase